MPDYALVVDESVGHLVAHTATCPVARKAADDGIPVATLLGALPLTGDPEVERHECLDDE
jgi:hypothetical protein